MALRACFGLTFDVDDAIVLDEFPEGDRDGVVSDVVVADLADLGIDERGAVRTRTLTAGGEDLFWVDRLADGRHRFTSPAHGVYVVAGDGGTVACVPNGRSPRWEAVLGAQVFPLASTLVGYEVFHASGVVVDGRAALLTAPPGTGKTSLAAHLVGLGAELLADDAVAVTLSGDTVRAHAAGRWLHLWPEEAERVLASYPAAFRSAGARDAKRIVEADRLAPASPIGAVYVLQRGGADGGPAVESAGDAHPNELLGATFNLSVTTPQRMVRQLDVCHAIARGVPVHRVNVRSEMPAAALAAELIAHMRRDPSA